jgi:hypothetical protein
MLDLYTNIKFQTMSIKSLMINCVESQYTQEYIANVFWRQNIAKVSTITLIPYLNNSEICSIAYINIDQWCDSEASYNFIQRLKDSSKEARIVHHDDEWWPVQINTHNNGEIYVGFYTLAFPSSYFVRSEPVDDDESTAPCSEVDEEEFMDDEEYKNFRETHPIQGLYNDYYTPEEAEAYVHNLKLELTRSYHRKLPDEALEEAENELAHLETELRIHEAVTNSGNVTRRESKGCAKVYPSDNGGRREVACSNMW